MFADVVFVVSMLISLGIGAVYFRDLGDVSQLVLNVKRTNMNRFIRKEYQLIGIGLAAGAIMCVAHLVAGGGPTGLFWVALIAILVLYGFPYVWVHVGLRNQKDRAHYYPISVAADYVNPSEQVMVIANGKVARAHSDAQIMRPHLAGNASGLDGENVVMTYCAMANLGVGYTPAIAGQALDLEVIAQHGNNLVLRDNKTGEPIQQIYGFRENQTDEHTDGAVCAVNLDHAMKPWPTFRMTFRGFQKAFPDGEVFVNMPPKNPLLWVFDQVLEMVFSSSIARQHRESKPVMDNMSHFDNRLPNKTYVWGINVGGDAVCWTDDFVVEQGNIVNATVGGRAVVLAWHPRYESLGAWYNTTGADVTEIDFWGETPSGTLQRVEMLKPGLFWHVWVEFFPHTDLNRLGVGEAPNDKAAA